MAEISNDTLALLMVAVIVVVIGAVVSLTWMGAGPTGADVSGGAVDLNVPQTLGIKVTQNTSFGSGYVNTSGGTYKNCTINSSGSRPPCWQNYTGTVFNPSDIRIRNDGNSAINVTVNTSIDSASMINRSDVRTNHHHFNFSIDQCNSSGCDGCDIFGGAGSWREFAANDTLYELFNWSSGCGSNKARMTIRLWIPSEVHPGKRNATLTFESTVVS
ncbi:MAG: hypothetical protein JSW73_03060 [Candidatus Woesearchaeota archaeon]|nr:MAG: hypothetical protein JSW73_03060 [Candidatus Woesearchaeota archaeon]